MARSRTQPKAQAYRERLAADINSIGPPDVRAMCARNALIVAFTSRRLMDIVYDALTEIAEVPAQG